LCAPLPELEDDSADTLANWAGETIDRYVDCSKRHKALVDWNKRK
jgi:hypothetical protein